MERERVKWGSTAAQFLLKRRGWRRQTIREQGKTDAGPPPGAPSALAPDFAAVPFDDILRNRQAEPGPTACAGAIRAEEALEHARQVFGRDARPGVGNLDYHVALGGAGAHPDLTPRRREFDR